MLETLDNGWTLVESYNSSYGPNCASRRGYGVTDDLIQGYVKTSLLKTITPRVDYGLLIDKLEQKMYIFSAGKCIGTLLVSTGLNNREQQWKLEAIVVVTDTMRKNRTWPFSMEENH